MKEIFIDTWFVEEVRCASGELTHGRPVSTDFSFIVPPAIGVAGAFLLVRYPDNQIG